MRIRSLVVAMAAFGLVTSSTMVPRSSSLHAQEPAEDSTGAATNYEAIAAHYEARAAEAMATASQHRAIARVHRRPMAKRPPSPAMVKHCEELADTMEKAAAAFSALAKDYREPDAVPE